MKIPKNYNPKEVEQKWQNYWEKNKIYKFDPKSKKKIYSIDTPPPTVSGKMHLGHSFSYSQMDFIARFKRMQGYNLFYPFGTDDNGLATERLIEKEKKVKAKEMSRKDFIKLCLTTLKTLRKEYLRDFKLIGLSCDWDIFYTTINDHCRKISQKSFIDLYKDKRAYRIKSPITICPHCNTAIAQVETEDKDKESTLNYIKAKLETGDYIIYATTRPELLPACVGITLDKNGTYVRAKKDNEIWIISKEAFDRFKDEWKLVKKEEIKGKDIVNKIVTLPITNAKLTLLHDTEAKTEYGSGIVYWCTYGGVECLEYLERHPEIEPIHIMDLSGKHILGPYKGLNSTEARKKVLKDLKDNNALVLMEKIKHTVNVHERCGTDIEYVSTEQWFIKYLDLKNKFLKAGGKLNWHPDYMKHRLYNWIKGLKWDWCISRQRFFGVPFPVWYCKSCGEVILADEKDLPVDPLKNKPKKCKCGSKEFIPEKDVLDTWATSSMTPQIAASLFPKVYDKLYPMSLRPQAHDIITFWLFNTMVKSQLHNNINPWKDVVISGWALDPKGKKMSKSKGNVIEPQEMMGKYSADSLRFWAASTKLGEDSSFQEKELISGQKFSTKLWNASKFSFMHLKEYKPKKPKNLETIDKWILIKLNKIIKDSTKSFENYEYSKTKADVENFFWNTFCDHYLEIIKDRLYNADKRGIKGKKSAQFTLYHSLLAILKLMSPIIPHITEEIYQLYFKKHEKQESIHISEWPTQFKIVDKKTERIGDEFIQILNKVRKFKTQNKLPLKHEITLTIPNKNKLKDVLEDLKAVTKAKEIKQGKLNIKKL